MWLGLRVGDWTLGARDSGINPNELGPLEISGRVKWVYVSDPDNNVIEFIQWL